MTDQNSTPENGCIAQQQSTRDSDEEAPGTDDEDVVQNLELNSDLD